MKSFTSSFVVSLFACAALLAGCSESPDDVAKAVRPMLQQQFDQGDFKQYGMKVTNVAVMHESGNKFQGVASVSVDGEEHSVPLEILDDGKQVMFSAQPGAFGFLAQIAMRKAQAQAAVDQAREIKSLLAQETKANERCRGGSGDDPNTQYACAERDAYVAELRGLGQCYGPPDAIEAEKRWGSCPAH